MQQLQISYWTQFKVLFGLLYWFIESYVRHGAICEFENV